MVTSADCMSEAVRLKAKVSDLSGVFNYIISMFAHNTRTLSHACMHTHMYTQRGKTKFIEKWYGSYFLCFKAGDSLNHSIHSPLARTHSHDPMQPQSGTDTFFHLKRLVPFSFPPSLPEFFYWVKAVVLWHNRVRKIFPVYLHSCADIRALSLDEVLDLSNFCECWCLIISGCTVHCVSRMSG